MRHNTTVAIDVDDTTADDDTANVLRIMAGCANNLMHANIGRTLTAISRTGRTGSCRDVARRCA